ncbi:G-type lectin S-receptor-like serine/threonine-protein kinase At4g27290 [Bidens hawaiensis]|uniref:G-type lectin S-receptor-like serine/threonine-protein kinase At4g27290 n=1 Tax=Bidens hawaiensis TaxID=980011 RepID=UPI00404A2397
MNQTIILLPSITFFFLMLSNSSLSLDTIPVNQNFLDGETIVSPNAKFELGFFSPGSSKYRYLGIWYKNTIPHTVAWVANRETPLTDSSGMVNLDSQGIMSLFNSGGAIIWSSNSSTSGINVNPVAQLLDTGNLVIKNESKTNKNILIWQSFDYPGDTYLPGMKLGKNFVTGREMYMTSWRSVDDPSPGEYTIRYSMVKGNYQQVYIRKSSVTETRFGPYNGITFAGQPSYKATPVYIFDAHMIANENEMYFKLTFMSNSLMLRLILTPGGKYEIWHLDMHNQEWTQDFSYPSDNCDSYGLCGPYGICNAISFSNCGCFKGFERNYKQELTPYNNWSSGCRRTKSLDCSPKEGFLKLSSMKLPDTQNAVFHTNVSLQGCEMACKSNCSCTAFANPNMTAGGVGCLLWFGDLIDMRVYQLNGQDLYVRLAASELLANSSTVVNDGNRGVHSRFSRERRVVITISLSTSAGLFVILATCTWIKRTSRADVEQEAVKVLEKDHKCSRRKGSIELPVFSLSTISRATNKFSIDNKLGEGGFGPVYKGVLEGQEIAVKRLSKASKQGLDEFKNEVICIAKLQHRNLVKLLGYCIQGEETMLVYEYMPNKSLDWFIFDDLRKSLLNWPQRFNIIHGIARGLLYLHQDSRHRVVHRDLKAGNILLDHDMNPKISDFGLARMFEGHESEANTKKVVGTLGYISPEYAANGLFSVKSDIFSYGVLVLEIVSGKKNRGFVHEDDDDINLLGHAWRLYKEGKSLDLIDTSLGDSWSTYEVLRSIHIGLLCVQPRVEDRPSTAGVVSMLAGEGSLPSPKKPAFFFKGSEIDSVSIYPSSINGVTLSEIDAR